MAWNDHKTQSCLTIGLRTQGSSYLAGSSEPELGIHLRWQISERLSFSPGPGLAEDRRNGFEAKFPRPSLSGFPGSACGSIRGLHRVFVEKVAFARS